MNYNSDTELSTDDTETMSEEERNRILLGYEFVQRRILEILSREMNIELEHITEIGLCRNSIRVSWKYKERTRRDEYETKYGSRFISYEALFSDAEEEAERARMAEEQKRAEEAEKQRQQEERRQAELRKQALIEANEKIEYLRLRKKYGEGL